MNDVPASPRTPRSTGSLFSVVVILAGFAFFAAAVAWILHLAGLVEDVEAKRAIERVEFLHKVRSRDTEALGSYGWADQAAGLARIPVRRAEELSVDRLRAKPIRAADLIPPPPPPPAAPVAAPPTAPAPAPAAKEGAPKPPKA